MSAIAHTLKEVSSLSGKKTFYIDGTRVSAAAYQGCLSDAYYVGDQQTDANIRLGRVYRTRIVHVRSRWCCR